MTPHWRWLPWLLCLLGCQHQPQSPKLAFYHWKSHLALSANEQSAALQGRRLYLRVFDVDLDGRNQCVPVAQLQITTPPPAELELVPTVFITNRAMKSLDEAGAIQLAQQVFQLVRSHVSALPPTANIPFWQMDCDWSPSSQAAYFAFLAQLKKQLRQQGQTLSATIRLHQYRSPETTGTPPINRGTLMVYNMGEVDDWTTTNSILDTTITWSYLQATAPYPVPLDIALPIFRWGAVYREKKLVELINDLSVASLQDTSRFEEIGHHRYQVKKSTYLNGNYLYAGDAIRLEAAQPEVLKRVNTVLAQQLPAYSDRDLIWYHLDDKNLQHYPIDFLEMLPTQWSQ